MDGMGYIDERDTGRVDGGEAVFPCEQPSPELSVLKWPWDWSTYRESHSGEGVQLQYPFEKSEILKPRLSI